MFEVETKFRIKNKGEIISKLKDMNCEFTKLHQCDHIYVKNGINNFDMPAGENVLRIRQQDGINYITLKQRLNHLEYETKVESFEVINNIFVALGYHELVVVDKFREETKIDNFNITIDEVRALGCFVEIERLTSNSSDIQIIQKEILNFAQRLGLSEKDIETEKYDTMMLSLNSNK